MTRQSLHELPCRFALPRSAIALSMGVLMTLSSVQMGRAESPSLAVSDAGTSQPPALSFFDGDKRNLHFSPRTPTWNDNAAKDRKRDLKASEKRTDGVVYTAPEAQPVIKSDTNGTHTAKHRRAAHSRRFHHGDHRPMRSRQISKKSFTLVDAYEGSNFFE